MPTNEMQKLDDLEAALYALASWHIQSPDSLALSSLQEALDEWPVPDDRHTLRGLDHIRHSFDTAETPQDIHQDMDQLYGITARATVPPFESVYVSPDGLLFEDVTLQVRDFYRTCGYEAPFLNREPDDHIGLELDFLGKLLGRAQESLAEGSGEELDLLTQARAFAAEHLFAWAPVFLARAEAEAHTSFVKGLQALTWGTLVYWGQVIGPAFEEGS
ncbi:MAG: molecular chaperone TorD family protein [Actinomycetaceae bacterium]|nr:molecular chaperone TorD family protein [Actinomycetaceae bacterium]